MASTRRAADKSMKADNPKTEGTRTTKINLTERDCDLLCKALATALVTPENALLDHQLRSDMNNMYRLLLLLDASHALRNLAGAAARLNRDRDHKEIYAEYGIEVRQPDDIPF